jgi:atypical dual specificity phosphatase
MYRRPQPVTWIEPDRLLACAYPATDDALAALATYGVTLVVNLHEQRHDSAALKRRGLEEIHLPVPDFTPPSPAQLAAGVATIEDAIASGQTVAVHCGAGLGRTGTLLACYLVSQGHSAGEAIARVRELRPGSVETDAQAAAVGAYGLELSKHPPRRGTSEDMTDDDSHST